MELIKKTVKVEDARGWYLLQNESKFRMEDFLDEDTNEVSSVERSEVILYRGCKLTAIDISTLKENGITTVRVSNLPVLGSQEKYMNLWETSLTFREKGKRRKRSYIVTADSPAAAETFISEYLEINVNADFELVKVNQTEYNRVIKVYDADIEAYGEIGKHKVKWYKCQVCATIEGETGEETEGGSRNVLVLALSLERAIRAVKAVFERDEFDSIYRKFKTVQELNIVDVFLPDEKAIYYSDKEIGGEAFHNGEAVMNYAYTLKNLGVTEVNGQKI
jgi:hypothetical protein